MFESVLLSIVSYLLKLSRRLAIFRPFMLIYIYLFIYLFISFNDDKQDHADLILIMEPAKVLLVKITNYLLSD